MEDKMQNHWGLKPGWTPGRKMWAFYLTFPLSGDWLDALSHQQQELSGLSTLDLVKHQWMHVSVQGVQFADLTDSMMMKRLADEACVKVGTFAPREPFRLADAIVDTNAVIVPVKPDDSIVALKGQLLQLSMSILGPNLPELPTPAMGFVPHVTIAYSNSTTSRDSVSARLPHRDVWPQLPNPLLSLVRVDRENRTWSWDQAISIR